MPFHRESRRAHRLIGGMLGVLVAVSLVAVAGPSHADDDYPYRGLGQCPLVPLPPHQHRASRAATPSRRSHQAGHGTHGKPDSPTKPAPPRECAKHIWYYNGTYGDPWGFALRNCTSFVAWRLRETNGIGDFTNHLGGGTRSATPRTGTTTPTALGYLVDDVPAVGAVAQTDDGRVGHVAWVSAVGDGTVTVEEYNYYVAGGYDVRTAPASDFRYLHLADVAPDPSLGSTRAAATTAAPGGGTWTARIARTRRPDRDHDVGATRPPRLARRLVVEPRHRRSPRTPWVGPGSPRCRRTAACSPRTPGASPTGGRTCGRSRAGPGRRPRPRRSPSTATGACSC